MAARRLIALLLAILLVCPLILGMLSVISITAWALDRDFYVDLVSDERLYDVLLSEEIPDMLEHQMIRGDVIGVSTEALVSALREVVTPDYLRSEAVRIVDDVFDTIETRGGRLDPYLDLVALKNTVADKDVEFGQAFASALPVCASGQEATITIEAGGGQTANLYRCIPSDSTADQVAADITAQLRLYLAEIPDRVDLSSGPIDVNTLFVGRFDWAEFGFFDVVGALNFSIVLLVAFVAALWLVTALIGGNNTRSRLQWLGWTLMLPALIVFFIGLAVNFAADPISTNFFGGSFDMRFGSASISPESRVILLDVFRSALNTIANGFLATGAVAGAIALAVLAYGWSIRYTAP